MGGSYEIPTVDRCDCGPGISCPDTGTSCLGRPRSPIYRFSGVYDDGGGTGAGTFSAVHCSNFSAVSEDIVVAVRHLRGTLFAVATFTLIPFRTFTAVTHYGNVFAPDANLATGVVDEGMFSIASTTTSITCTAMVVSGSATTIQGVELHAHRYSPEPGTDE